MSVYIDDMRAPFKPAGRRAMRMCHMIADTHEELIAMVRKIGVSVQHIQNSGTPREHFDVCMSKRELAIREGAITITIRDLAAKVRERKAPT